MQIRRLGCQPSRVRLDATRPCSARSLCAFACVQFFVRRKPTGAFGVARRAARLCASRSAAPMAIEKAPDAREGASREGPYCVRVMHKWGCAPGSRDTRVCVFLCASIRAYVYVEYVT